MKKTFLATIAISFLSMNLLGAEVPPKENFVSRLLKGLGKIEFRTRFKVKGSSEQSASLESLVFEGKAPLLDALKMEIGQAKDSPYVVLGEKNILLKLSIKTDAQGEMNSVLSFTDLQANPIALPIALKNLNSTNTAFKLYQLKAQGSGFGPASEKIDVIADCTAEQEALNYRPGSAQPILRWQGIDVCRFTVNYNKKTSQWDYVFDYDSTAKP